MNRRTQKERRIGPGVGLFQLSDTVSTVHVAPQVSTGVPAKAVPKSPQQGSSSTAGVRIATSSFSLQETFLTSPDELYRTFINQEVENAAALVIQDDINNHRERIQLYTCVPVHFQPSYPRAGGKRLFIK